MKANERHYQSIVMDDLELIYPFACRNELSVMAQKQYALSLILDN